MAVPNNQFTGDAPPLQPASYFNKEMPTEESNPFAFVSTTKPPMQGHSSAHPSQGSSGFFDQVTQPWHSQESAAHSGAPSDVGYSSMLPTHSQETQPPSSHNYTQSLPHAMHPSYSFTEGMRSQPGYSEVREAHRLPSTGSAVESSIITQPSQGAPQSTGIVATQPPAQGLHGRQTSLPPLSAASLFSSDTYKDDFFSSLQGQVSQPSLSAPSTALQAIIQPDPPVPTQESGPSSNADISQPPVSLSPVLTLPQRPPSNADSAPTSLDVLTDRPLTNADFPPTSGLKMTNSMDQSSPPHSAVGTPLPATNDEIASFMNPVSGIKLVSPRDTPSAPVQLMPPRDNLDKSTSSLLDSQEDFTSTSPIRILPPAPSGPAAQAPEPWNGSMKDWEIISDDTVKRTDPVLESNVIDHKSLSSQVAQLNITSQSGASQPSVTTAQARVSNQQETVDAIEPGKNVLVPSQGFTASNQGISSTVAAPLSTGVSQYVPQQTVQYQAAIQSQSSNFQSVSQLRSNQQQAISTQELQHKPSQPVTTTINQYSQPSLTHPLPLEQPKIQQVEEHPPQHRAVEEHPPQHHRAVEEHPPQHHRAVEEHPPQHHRAVEEHPPQHHRAVEEHPPQHHRAVEEHPPQHHRAVEEHPPQHHRAVEEHPPQHHRAVEEHPPQHHRAVEEHPPQHHRAVEEHPPQHHRAVEEHPPQHHRTVDYGYDDYYRGYPNERYRQPSDYYPPPHEPRARDPRHDPRYYQPRPHSRHPYPEPYHRPVYGDQYEPQYRDPGYYDRYQPYQPGTYPEEQYYDEYNDGYYGNEPYYGQEYDYDYNAGFEGSYVDQNQFQPIANQSEVNLQETSAIPGHTDNFVSGQTFIDSPQVQPSHGGGYYNPDGSYTNYGYDYPDHGGQSEPAREVTPPPTPRQTPEHFAQPHTRASFGFGGQLVTVLPHLKRQGLAVEIASLKDVLADKETVTLEEAVNSFPGPFLPGSTPKNTVVQYINGEIRRIRDQMAGLAQQSFELKLLHDEVLLWQFLLLLCRQNGSVLPTDIADLLIGETSTSVNSQLHLGTANKDQALAELRDLLLSGQRKAALDLACANCLWGHALMLADEQSRNYVVNRFTASLSSTDPLATFYTLLLGQLPSAVKHDGLSRAGDWRPHLAMILSNKTGTVNTAAIISLGDSLLSQGRLCGAHLCYYLGNLQFGSYGEQDSKYTILGVHQSSLVGRLYPDPRDLRKMEVFEYAMSLSKQEFSLPGFQMYKFLLVLKLLECGYVDKAVKYCEQISLSVLKSPKHYTQVFLTTLLEISVKLHHMTSPYGVVENELPNWLSVLERCDVAASDSTPRLFSPSPAFSSVSQTFTRNHQAVTNPMLTVPTSQYRTTPVTNTESNENWGSSTPHQDLQTTGGEAVTSEGPQWTGSYGQQPGDQITNYQQTFPQQESPPSDPPPVSDATQPLGYYEGPQQTLQQEPAYTLHPPSDYGQPLQSENAPQEIGSTSYQPGPFFYPQQPVQQVQPAYDYSTGNTNVYDGVRPVGLEGSGSSGGDNATPPQPTSRTPQPESHDQSPDSQVTKNEPKADKKVNKEPEKKKSGWGSGLMGIFFKRKNEAHLPTDKDKSIYYDEDLKKWINKDAPEEEEAPPPPPPSDSQLQTKASQPADQVDGPGDQLPSTQTLNQFSRAGAKRGRLGARSKYVDVMNPGGGGGGSGPPPPAGMLGAPLMPPGQLPGTFFVPQLPPEDKAQGSPQPEQSPASEQQPTSQTPQHNQTSGEHSTQYHSQQLEATLPAQQYSQPAQQYNQPLPSAQQPPSQAAQQQYYSQGVPGQQFHQQPVSTPSNWPEQKTGDAQPTPQFFNPSAFAPVGSFPPQSNQQDDTMSTVSMMSEASQEVSSYMQSNKSTGYHQRPRQAGRGLRGYPQVKQAPPSTSRQPQQARMQT